ncbi:hypothetical protein AAIG11_01465 [Anoxynatronum sibiricum]|uniref:Uncharacterized protein n=2 Tax=Anoxynatronum sibiricum TaxID=210623 RepID=A0ABU9VPP8_9CLOT
MFFKKCPKIHFDPEVVRAAQLPLLSRDAQWKKMTDGIRNRKMTQLMQETEVGLQEQKQLQQKIRQLKTMKKQLTQEILEHSHTLNQNGNDFSNIQQMDIKRDTLRKTSEELESAYGRLEALPDRLEDVNLQLLEETASAVCRQMLESDAQNQKLDQQIRELRDKLNQLREEKEQVTERLETWYSFLHHLVGPKEMEKLDSQIAFQPQPDQQKQVKK